MTHSLQPAALMVLGEDTDDVRLQMRGWSWPACTVSQVGSVDVDATPKTTNWTAGSNTNIGGTGPLTITVGSSGTGSVSSALANARPAPDTLTGSDWQGVSFAGYRFLRLYLTVTLQGSETSQPARVTIGSKQWDFTVTGSGYVDIDLCCPTNIPSGSVTVDGQDSQWTWTGNSSGPYAVTDGLLWGVSNVANFVLGKLAQSHVYMLTKVQLVRKDHSGLTLLPDFKAWVQAFPAVTNDSDTTTTTYYRRFVDGDTDGRRSLENTDWVWVRVVGSSGTTTDTYTPVSIAQFVAAKTAATPPTVDTFPLEGWSATDLQSVPTSGCPDANGNYALHNCYLNSSLPSTFLYGGGAIYDGKQWQFGFDISVSNGATLPAQLLFDVIDWYPECGDVWGWSGGSYGGPLQLAAAKILRGQAYGLATNINLNSNQGVKVLVIDSTTSADAGSGITTQIGEYKTGLPYPLGQKTYTVEVQTGATPYPSITEPFETRKRQRVSFARVPVTSPVCCQQIFCSDRVLFPFALQSGDNGRLPVADGRGLSVVSGPGFAMPSTAGAVPWQLFQYSALPNNEGPFGFGWRASWPLRLCESTAGTAATGYVSTIVMEREDGNSVQYVGSTTGPSAQPPTTFTASSPRLFDTLLRNADQTFDETRFASGAVFHYPAPPSTSLTSYTNLVSLSYYQTVQNQRVSFAYNGSGQLTNILEPSGRQIVYNYDPTNATPYVASVVDWAGRTHGFQYDSNRNLNQIQDPTGALTTISYGSGHIPISVVDPNNVPTLYGYDTSSRVISRKVGANPAGGYSYVGGTTVYTDPIGHVWSTTQDSDGNVTQAVDPLGATRNATFTTKGQPQTIQDAILRSTVLGYDSNGCLTSYQTPDGQSDLFNYDSYGNCTLHQDPENRLTTYTYGTDPSQRRVAAMVTAVPSTYIYSHTSWGALLSETTPLGNTTTLNWDTTGLLRGQTNPLGFSRVYGYDSAANCNFYQDETGKQFNSTYDGVGRQLSRSNTVGGLWQMVYDPVGNPTVHIDPLGQRTKITFNAYNEPVSITDARNALWQQTYDGKGRPQLQIDPIGNATSVVFDNADRLIQSVDAMGRVVGYQYDLARQLTTLVDTTGLATGMHYDPAGRLDVATAPTGLQTHYFYNHAGQPTAVQDSANLYATTVYDQAGRPWASVMPDGARATTSYDLDSRPIAIRNARGFLTTMQFDAATRMTTLIDAAARIFTTGFDNSGRTILERSPFGTSLQRDYDGAGRLRDTVDHLGRRTTFSYYATDLLQTVQDSIGNTYNRFYDATYNLTTYLDELGQAYVTVFDTAGRAISKKDPLNNLTQLQYDPSSALTTMIDAKNQNWATVFDAYGRPQVSVNPLNERTTTLYDTYGRYQGQWRPDNAYVTLQYDPYGRPSTMIDGLGCAFVPVYDVYGRRTGMTGPNGYNVALDLSQLYAAQSQVGTIDPLGHRTMVVADALGRPIQVVDALNKMSLLQYDGRGNLQSTSDPLHRTMQYNYDQYSRLNTILDPDLNVTTLSYDDNPAHPASTGRLWYSQNPDGNFVTLHYDTHGRQDATQDEAGFRTTTIFDSIGRIGAQQDQKGFYTNFSYDQLHRLQSVTKPTGAILTTVYDPLDRVSQVINAKGVTTSILYDNPHRKVTVWKADGSLFTKTYDPAGNLSTVVNPNGKTTTNIYDCLHNKIQVQQPLNRTLQYQYDAASRLITLVDSKGQTTTIAYTARNQESVRYLPGGGRNTYLYDDSGALLEVDEPAGAHVFTYDTRGLLETESHPNYPPGAYSQYRYNKTGHRVSMISWLGTFGYMLDPRNLLSGVTDPGYSAAGISGGSTSYVLDERGQIAQTVFPNGALMSATYDPVGLPTRLYHCTSAGTLIDDIQYTRDLLDLPMTKSTRNGMIAYGYDAVNQLVSENNPAAGLSTLTYDTVGRRQTLQTALGTSQYAYDDADQMISLQAPNPALSLFIPDSVPNYRMDCGSTTSVGLFSADQYCSSSEELLDYTYTTTVDLSGVTNPAPQEVYQTIRYVATAGPFTYTLPGLTPNAPYKVRLHLATNDTAAGNRAISVSINGVTVISNLDVFAQAGGGFKALIEEVVGTADSGGNLAIALTGDPAKPFPSPSVCALEVLPQLHRIDCGSATSVGSFTPDLFVSSNDPLQALTVTNTIDTSGVYNPAPMAVYQSFRYVTTVGPFTYTLPYLIPNAQYLVRLHFALYVDTGAGQNAMTITLNGRTVISGLDVYVAAGGINKALVQQVLGTADAQGRIVLAFTGDATKTYPNPYVQGIEVLPPRLYAMDCGSATAVGLFSADEYCTSSSPLINYTYTPTVDLSGVSNPAPQEVYQTIRYVADAGPFTYTLPGLTPNTPYKVRLHFATNDTAAGNRAISVSINGVTVISNLDVFAQAGGGFKALIEEVVGTADSGGNLAIALTGDPSKRFEQPCLCAIEVFLASIQTLFSYDNNGNRTLASSQGNITSYTWDDQDRLVGVASPTAGLFTMGYGYDGLRLWQQGGDGSVASFVYDGDNVLSWQKGTLSQLLVQGEGILRSVGLTESGAALNRIYHVDGQGTTVATTTGSQALETDYQTDAWGNTLAGSAADNPYIYGGSGGYWQEPELGLTYVGARWLEPQTGTWLSVDPVVGEPAYSYAYNSPTAYMDPSGMQSQAEMDKRANEARQHLRSGKLVEGDASLLLDTVDNFITAQERAALVQAQLAEQAQTAGNGTGGGGGQGGGRGTGGGGRTPGGGGGQGGGGGRTPSVPRPLHPSATKGASPAAPPVHVAPAAPPATSVPHLDAKQRSAYEQNLQELQRDVIWGKQWGMLDQGMAYYEGGMQGLLIAQVALSDAATFGLLSRLNIVSEDFRNQDGYQFSYHAGGVARDALAGVVAAPGVVVAEVGEGAEALNVASRIARGSWWRPSMAPSLFGQAVNVARPLAYGARGLQAGESVYNGYTSAEHIFVEENGSGWDWLNLGLSALPLAHASWGYGTRGFAGLNASVFDWEGAGSHLIQSSSKVTVGVNSSNVNHIPVRALWSAWRRYLTLYWRYKKEYGLKWNQEAFVYIDRENKFRAAFFDSGTGKIVVYKNGNNLVVKLHELFHFEDALVYQYQGKSFLEANVLPQDLPIPKLGVQSANEVMNYLQFGVAPTTLEAKQAVNIYDYFEGKVNSRLINIGGVHIDY